jgi:hypothetical protein
MSEWVSASMAPRSPARIRQAANGDWVALEPGHVEPSRRRVAARRPQLTTRFRERQQVAHTFAGENEGFAFFGRQLLK